MPTEPCGIPGPSPLGASLPRRVFRTEPRPGARAMRAAVWRLGTGVGVSGYCSSRTPLGQTGSGAFLLSRCSSSRCSPLGLLVPVLDADAGPRCDRPEPTGCRKRSPVPDGPALTREQDRNDLGRDLDRRALRLEPRDV